MNDKKYIFILKHENYFKQYQIVKDFQIPAIQILIQIEKVDETFLIYIYSGCLYK